MRGGDTGEGWGDCEEKERIMLNITLVLFINMKKKEKRYLLI